MPTVLPRILPHAPATEGRKERAASQSAGERTRALSTPTSVKKRGFVWLGAAALAVVLQAEF